MLLDCDDVPLVLGVAVRTKEFEALCVAVLVSELVCEAVAVPDGLNVHVDLAAPSITDGNTDCAS